MIRAIAFLCLLAIPAISQAEEFQIPQWVLDGPQEVRIGRNITSSEALSEYYEASEDYADIMLMFSLGRVNISDPNYWFYAGVLMTSGDVALSMAYEAYEDGDYSLSYGASTYTERCVDELFKIYLLFR